MRKTRALPKIKAMNMMLVAASVFVSLGFVEWGMSMLAPRYGLTEPYEARAISDNALYLFHQPDATFGYARSGNVKFPYVSKEYRSHVSVNRFGFRGPEFSRDGRAIFIIGDSFIEAFHVLDHETAAALLPVKLAASGYPYRVNNLGVGSYSVVQYYNLMREYSPKWHPDIVVMILYGNDILHDKKHSQNPNVTRDDSGLVTHLPEREVKYLGRESKISRLYISWVLEKFIDRLSHKPILKSEQARHWGLLDPKRKSLYQTSLKYIAASKELCDDLGNKLVVSAIPFGNQVGPDQMAVGYHGVGTTHVPFEFSTQYPDIIRDFCRDRDIPYMDLLEPFRGYALKGEKLYFTYDGHLTKKGNARLADVLERFLIDNDIVNREFGE